MALEKSNPHMQLWDSVKTTDKKYTKTQQLDGRPVTSINGMYIVQRATEAFGPIGKGWGYDILVDRFDQGAPITGKDGILLGYEQVHTIQIKLWYVRGGKRNHVTHYGHTPFVRKSQFGPYTDFDAPKKSLTDAIKKSLSLVGFSADVHLGMFEDEVYLEGLKLKQRLEEAGEDGAQEVLSEAKAEFRNWVETQIQILGKANNQRALEALRKNVCAKAREKAEVVNYDPSDIEQRINEAAAERMAFLDEKYPSARLTTPE
ncbi:hypothetical protein SAMN05216588_101239 [Pseudomonas flavescens]|uniref:Rad52/22 family double-strand break repair protein n=1 Tax=Phytopseudomonas flavescens TaxID=29435 RepID=A0A1G7XRE0_9GAMM|nr:hypothetical protein [Pseudomonas flavescens]SDG86691.1 hypothetical protein SAMN05216588_101239 [Pseudomonas flavescens]